MLGKIMHNLWQRRSGYTLVLVPLSWLFAVVITLRRLAYALGLFRSKSFPVPVVMVGNITVGGCGKTPLVIYLCELLKGKSYRPGVVLRGYGGHFKSRALAVGADSNPYEVGDEAVLIAKRSEVPVVVGRSRVSAVDYLLTQHNIDVVLCDDGLQHYGLARDLEVAVIDGERRFGNGFYLPAGPLRESVRRLSEVDMLVCNGHAKPYEFAMTLKINGIYPVSPKNTDRAFDWKACSTMHVLAGIGNPQRFFDLWLDRGFRLLLHNFSDHHSYTRQDINFGDDFPVMMTEKDAVKCQNFADDRHWYMVLGVDMPAEFVDDFLNRLVQIKQRVTSKNKSG